MRNPGDVLTNGLRLVSGLALLLLMAIVVADVAGREFFATPLRGITELNEIVLGAIVFFGYPVLALKERHIRVDLVPLGPRLNAARRIATGLIGAALFGAIGWRMWEQAERVAGYGDRSPMLGIPSWAVLGVIAALAGVTALAFLVMIVRTLAGRPEPDQEALPTE